jgi:carboxypeptidase PM20D1
MLKRLLQGVLLLLLVLAAVLAVNTVRQGSLQVNVPALAVLAVDEAAVGTRLSEAVRTRTIASRTDPQQNAQEFATLQAQLQANYPKAHAALQREAVGGLTLLYTWKGSRPEAAPILMLAHQDVVPVSPGTESRWTQPPFSGAIQGGFVWGRGAWDNKGNLVAQMEAIEMLVASGYQPERTVYLCFGADEEVGGLRGAAKVAELLRQRGVQLEFVIDEGLLITEGVLSGLHAPAALVGIAEKGYLSVVLKLPATPGHSSMPPSPGQSAIGMMSAALRRIDDEQLPAGIRGVAGEMFRTLAPEMTPLQRVLLSNLWLFGPLVQRQLEAGASTNAMLRTTTALTTVHAGDADNVMPGQAEATVNYRLLPGDSSASVIARMKGLVQDTLHTERFELLALPGGSEASPVSPTASASYQLVQRTVREVFPGTLVAPSLMIAGTDSRYFTGISKHVYRFSPVRATSQDLQRFHGTDERLSLQNLAEMVRFYHRLVSQGAKAS